MLRVTLDFDTDQGLPDVLMWVLATLEEEPQDGTVLREIHASAEPG